MKPVCPLSDARFVTEGAIGCFLSFSGHSCTRCSAPILKDSLSRLWFCGFTESIKIQYSSTIQWNILMSVDWPCVFWSMLPVQFGCPSLQLWTIIKTNLMDVMTRQLILWQQKGSINIYPSSLPWATFFGTVTVTMSLLHLLFLVSTASAWSRRDYYRFIGGSLTFTPKHSNGKYEVIQHSTVSAAHSNPVVKLTFDEKWIKM